MATTKKTTAKKAAAPKKTTKAKAIPVAEQVECIPKDPEPMKETEFRFLQEHYTSREAYRIIMHSISQE